MGTGDLVCLFSGKSHRCIFLCRRFKATFPHFSAKILSILGWDVFGVFCLRKNRIKRVGKGNKINVFCFFFPFGFSDRVSV